MSMIIALSAYSFTHTTYDFFNRDPERPDADQQPYYSFQLLQSETHSKDQQVFEYLPHWYRHLPPQRSLDRSVSMHFDSSCQPSLQVHYIL
mmetsp:Transcript_4390/g.7405  ORF Transcript_4390/g.7405 Transcript_4390/m.7405 type:complete len:91 (-) Transcript_4390:934-1206(-)